MKWIPKSIRMLVNMSLKILSNLTTMRYSKMNLKLREQVLKILLHEFGDTASNRSIYECADEWCSKQVTANGIVNYFKAYYTK